MSNNGGWKPRKQEPYTCEDGSIVYIRRPGPEFTIRAGRIVHVYNRMVPDSENPLAGMSDEDERDLVTFARQLIVAMVTEPKLCLNPGPDQLGPDDTGPDFWPLFHYGMSGLLNLKIPIGDGEVEAQDLSTFRAESGVSGHSMDGAHVPSNTEQPTGDQGLVDRAGI